MKKRLSVLFVALFLLVSLVPSAGVLLWGESDALANEVRSPRPVLIRRDGSLDPGFPAGCAAYVNDRFALRRESITLWAKLNAVLFHTSVAEDVILGRNGWLYYAPTLPDYTGSDTMTEREIFCAARSLALLREYALSQGAELLFTIAPNKNSLYPDDMPFAPAPREAANAERLREALAEQGVPYADLFVAFAAESDTLYFAGDSHWTGRGAALAADTLLSALGRESGWYRAPFARTERAHTGDLYEMLYPAGREKEPDETPAGGFSYTVTSSSPDPDSILLTTESAGTGRLLCYRDSFGRNLIPYLAASFAEAVFSRKSDYRPDGLRPGDAMLIELVERNLSRLAAEAPTFPAPVRDLTFADLPETPGAVCRLSVPDADGSGMQKITGIFQGVLPKDDSFVYIIADRTVYEASPTAGGFSACLPVPVDPASLEVCFFPAAQDAPVRAALAFD